MNLIELAARKKLELNQKMNALEREFEEWFQRSANAESKFAKHHTQIRAIRAMLKPRHEEIRADFDSYTLATELEANDFLGNCANSEKLILSEHRIWNYFRGKFIQRDEPTFDLYLKIADEFAWECYRPIQEIVYPDPATARRKEPPLVFFNGGASPFSVSRDRAFEPESVVGGGISLDSETVGKLPIPVVGIPWHQVKNLPEILVIGHEVGHIVEKDFGLTDELQNHLAAALDQAQATDERKTAWKSWLAEIFADLYGCLAAGASFAGTLIDFVVNDQNLICEETQIALDWGKYPTIYLRVKIVLEALKHLGFGEEINKYDEFWTKNYTSAMPAEYSNETPLVAASLLDGAYQCLGGKSIRQIFQFTAEMQEKVGLTVNSFAYITNGSSVQIPADNLRTIFAALRKSFEEQPANFIANKYDRTVLAYVENNILKSGVRGGENTVLPDAIETKLQEYNKLGAELLKLG